MNIYYVPFSIFEIRQTDSFHHLMPIDHISLFINVLLLSAILVFTTKLRDSLIVLCINCIGYMIALPWLVLLLTIPKMD